MKRYKFLPIFLFSLVLFSISFIFGYKLMGISINQRNIVENSKENDLDMEILQEENRITPNTLIEERIHHINCGHIITKVKGIDDEIINMDRDEYIDYLNQNYPDKRLISYSQNKITLGVTKNHLCEDHYIIGEENGFMAIFEIDENGGKVLSKIFDDYPISILMEIDQEKIKEGIVVDSEEELSEILENFIS